MWHRKKEGRQGRKEGGGLGKMKKQQNNNFSAGATFLLIKRA
jgi:hypothetical protein